MYAQLITKAHNWRYIGFLVGGWNLLGLILVLFCYHDPVRKNPRPAKEILREVDYIGGALSTVGVTLFMMGMQWGANQVCCTVLNEDEWFLTSTRSTPGVARTS